MTSRDGRRRWVRSIGVLGLAGALVLSAAAPAFADPEVPDPGTRPNPGSSVPGPPAGAPGLPGAGSGQPGGPGLPGAGGPGVPDVDPPVMGPLATRIGNEQRAVEMLGEQLKDAEGRVTDLRRLVDAAQRTADAADEALERAEARTENVAGEAYREHAAVPEQLREFAPGLQHLAPGLRDSSSVESKAAADSYQAALDLAETAHDALDAARSAYQTAADDLAKLRRDFQQRQDALADLRAQNADALREAERAADRYAASIPFDPGGAVNGLLPNPKAVKAVKYALAQLGKPYVWGDEGPDTFDCSGLVYAAYRFAGVTMTARTARQQYYSTPMVAPGHMLPGDLVFFGPDKSNPESIHHVGIYIGKNRIVHAPTAGDVVKVSPIWWWEFFAATRVVPAVKAPKPKPKPTPTPSPSTSPTPRPTWSPTKPPSSPPPSSPPPSSGSPSPTPSASDSPSPAPGPSGSASASPSWSPSSSPSSSPYQKAATVPSRRRTRAGCVTTRRSHPIR